MRVLQVRSTPGGAMVEVAASPLHANDAFLWVQESDPALRSTTLGIAVLDRSPAWDRLVKRTERATKIVPTMRQRIAEPALRLGPLQWVPDPDFDLTYHLRRVEAPQPKTLEAVVEIARTSAMAGFDRARPLWESILVDGLEGGQAAFITKLHHVLADGIGAMQLAALVFDLEREPPVLDEQLPAMEAPEPASGLGVLRRALRQEAGEGAAFARDAAASAIPSFVDAVRHPGRAAGDAIETARSIWHTVQPVTETLSPIMTERGLRWQFHTLEIPLAGLHDVAKPSGFTVNDAYLAAITGGFRRYHKLHGCPVDELRVAIPISMRTEDDPPGGNHVTLMRFRAPVSQTDPRERMERLHQLVNQARTERSLPYTNTIATVLNLLPPAVVGSMVKHVDFLASNVPGLTAPIYVAGAEVVRYYPFGPTLGSAVNITLLSYRDICCVGITSDAQAVPDSEAFLDCMRAGFDEVAAL